MSEHSHDDYDVNFGSTPAPLKRVGHYKALALVFCVAAALTCSIPHTIWVSIALAVVAGLCGARARQYKNIADRAAEGELIPEPLGLRWLVRKITGFAR